MCDQAHLLALWSLCPIVEIKSEMGQGESLQSAWPARALIVRPVDETGPSPGQKLLIYRLCNLEIWRCISEGVSLHGIQSQMACEPTCVHVPGGGSQFASAF